MTRPAILGKLIDPAWAAQEINRLNAENERLRNIALDSLPYLQSYAAGMRGGPDRAKLRAVIGQIIAFVPDDEQEGAGKCAL